MKSLDLACSRTCSMCAVSMSRYAGGAARKRRVVVGEQISRIMRAELDGWEGGVARGLRGTQVVV